MKNNSLMIRILLKKYKKESRLIILGNILLFVTCCFLYYRYHIYYMTFIIIFSLANLLAIIYFHHRSVLQKEKTIKQIGNIINTTDFQIDFLEDYKTRFDNNDSVNEILKSLAELIEKNASLEDFCLLANKEYPELQKNFIGLYYALKNKKGIIEEETTTKNFPEKNVALEYVWIILSGILVIIIGYSLFMVIGGFLNA